MEFSTSLAKLSGRERDRLAAQIVWTLRSVPGLRGVRIFGGTAILSSQGKRVHPVDSWGGFGPPSGHDHTYALVDDKLVEVDGATVRPVDGAWGDDAGGAVEAAVTDDAVAAVLRGRDQVRVTDRAGRIRSTSTAAGRRTPGGSRGPPLARRPTGGSTRVRVVEDGRTRTLSARGLRGLTVRSFALSPDGGRYAVAAADGGRVALRRAGAT